MEFESTLKKYLDLIDLCPRFEKKGKTVPYTSANGHMFSFINKSGELGIRFDKKTQESYFIEFDTSYLISHNAKMKGYIRITEEMLKDNELIVKLLNESYDYVMALDPK